MAINRALTVEQGLGSMDDLVGRLGSLSIETRRVPAAFFSSNSGALLDDVSVVVIDAGVGADAIRNSINAAASYGIPRILKMPSGAVDFYLKGEFAKLRATPLNVWVNAVICPADSARKLIYPNNVEWPPDASVAKSLTKRCKASFVAVDDIGKGCWHWMNETGRIHKHRLPKNTTVAEFETKVACALIALSLMGKHWKPRMIEDFVLNT